MRRLLTYKGRVWNRSGRLKIQLCYLSSGSAHPYSVHSGTPFTDNGNLNTGYVSTFSSNWNNDLNAGVFQLNVNYTATSNSNANIGAHLMFSMISDLVPSSYIFWCNLYPWLLPKHKNTKSCVSRWKLESSAERKHHEKVWIYFWKNCNNGQSPRSSHESSWR